MWGALFISSNYMKTQKNVDKVVKLQCSPVSEHKVIYKQRTITLDECLEQLRALKSYDLKTDTGKVNYKMLYNSVM